MANEIDPVLFGDKVVDDETVNFNAKIEKILVDTPPLSTVDINEVRQFRREAHPVFGPVIRSDRAETRNIETTVGNIPVRIFQPEKPCGVYLHFHGGGWVMGAVDMHDLMLERYALNAGLVVVSVDYRLAPESPYPAGPDDCEAAALWLIKNAKSEFGTDNIVIGGESAGAHLAMVTLCRMRDRHDYHEFCAANLMYGVFDLTLTPSVRAWQRNALVLNRANMQWFVDQFIPTGIDLRHPDVSPLYADLAKLPPALVTIGTEDLLLDDSLFMYSRYCAAGNQASINVCPGGAHGFTTMPIALAYQALARSEIFLRSAVGNRHP